MKKSNFFPKVTINYFLFFLGLILFALQSCDSIKTENIKPKASSIQAKMAAIIYSENFETAPLQWKVYTTSWTQGYATNYALSKRLDQANLYAVFNRTVFRPVIYQTSTPILFQNSGDFTISYSTIKTATTTGNASIDFILINAISGAEQIISSTPITSNASPLTVQTAIFSLPTAGQYYLKVISSGNITPTPTKAGHCYIDNIEIQ